MANDWYVSSAAYAAIPVWQATHAYVIGDIIRPTAPALRVKYAFRCTTAGTSGGTEPASWSTANNSTTASGTATFTNVSGQSTYFWAAAAGDVPSITATRIAANDRVFISSDHTETQTSGLTLASAGASFGVNQFLCVNRAGSTPPVAADLTTGATLTVNSALTIDSLCETYHYGITYTITSSSNISFNGTGVKSAYLQNCQLYLNNSNSLLRIAGGNPATVTLDNTTMQFGGTSQFVTSGGSYRFEIIWQNTPSAIAGATIPSVLFQGNANGGIVLATVRGVDLSAITGTLVKNVAVGSKYLFDSCKIASGVTRYDLTGVTTTADLVELVNCYDGTHFLNECYQPSGAVTTEFTNTLSGGAADNVGPYSLKMVSNTNIDKFVNTLNGFWMDCNYTITGSSKTATVEIISSASLNNDEISLLLEYEGTAGSSVASFGSSFANPLTVTAAITSSSATWNNSPATPVKQKLQVTFTPQVAGRVRGQVRLGKASTTVWVNPQITIS